MQNYVFLIRNNDLCYLGKTKNIENTQKALKPGKLIAYLKTDEADSICLKLYQRYKQERLPGSEYFKLSKIQIADCKLILKGKSSMDYFQPIFSGPILFLAYFLSWILFSSIIIFFGLQPIFDRFA